MSSTLEKEIDPKIFRFILGVDSESDGLPIGPERKHWATEALCEKDDRANAYEMQVRRQLLKAAEYLVFQFSKGKSSLP